jgi:hypothetical protein
MSVPLATFHESDDRPRCDTHDVMCLVKRHTYELTFAIPHTPQTQTRHPQPHVYVRVKAPGQAAGFILDLPDVEQLYEDLLQMLEYLQRERRKTEVSKSFEASHQRHTPGYGAATSSV